MKNIALPATRIFNILMGLFSFLFNGGNVGQIVQSLAYHHNRLGSFEEVIQVYLSDFKSRSIDSSKYEKARFAVAAIEDGNIIKNYRNLAVLALVVDAAPPSHYFAEVLENFGEELETRLQKHGLSQELVSGNAFNV
tara:strand:+ start:8631 stop:9041 length:411 start_codon:yes stop_codon:yes gene_type:complete